MQKAAKLSFMRPWPIVAIFVISAAPASAQFLPQSLRHQLRPIAQLYKTCALDHMKVRAAADPALSFEAQEGSLRAACGRYVDDARRAFAAAGYDRMNADAQINALYLELQPELRGAYDEQAAEERRSAVAKKAATEHRDCLSKAFTDLVPYSAEGADTLATAVMARCLEHENRRTSLAIGLFGLSLPDARGVLSEIFGKLRREIERDVVAFRAEKSRRPPIAAPAPKAPEQEMSATSGTGFFVGTKGHVVTNNHVVTACKVIHLKPDSGSLGTATVYARDVMNDLALLKTDVQHP